MINFYPPGFKVNLHFLDLSICKQMAKDMNIESIPVTEQTMRDYEELIEQGYSEEDVSSVFRLKHRTPKL